MTQKDDYQLNHAAVYFYAGVYDDGYVYMAEIDTNLLLRLDIQNRGVDIVDSLKNAGIDCCGILKRNNKIIVSYRDKSSEMMVNSSGNDWVKKDIDYCGSFENNQAYEFKESLFVLDKDFGIKKFDAEFNNINNFAFPDGAVGIQASRISETKIAIVTENSKVIEFDLSTEKVTELELPQKIDDIETICHDGENYWFTTYNWEIIRVNLHNKDIQRYPMPEKLTNIENQKDKRRFEKSFFYKGKIWVIPFYASNIMLISTQDGNAELIRLEETEQTECIEMTRRNSMQYISVFCEQGILLLSCVTQRIYYLDAEDGRVERLDLHSIWRKKDISRFGVINEGLLGINIKQFLNAVVGGE